MKKTFKIERLLSGALLLVMGIFLAGCSKATPEQIAERTELLFKAIGSNDVEMVKLCIKTGANVNAEREFGLRNDKYTPLMYAIQNDNEEIADILIKSKADVNHKDPRNKFSPLIWAMRSSNKNTKYRMIDKLVKAKADLNAGLFYAANYAVSSEDIEYLIKSGADINAQNEKGWTPLMLAASTGAEQVVLPLLQAGAKVNIKSNDGDTALSLAKNSSNWNKQNAITLLEAFGAKE